MEHKGGGGGVMKILVLDLENLGGLFWKNVVSAVFRMPQQKYAEQFPNLPSDLMEIQKGDEIDYDSLLYELDRDGNIQTRYDDAKKLKETHETRQFEYILA
jgi:hypothetical protein